MENKTPKGRLIHVACGVLLAIATVTYGFVEILLILGLIYATALIPVSFSNRISILVILSLSLSYIVTRFFSKGYERFNVAVFGEEKRVEKLKAIDECISLRSLFRRNKQ